MHGHENRGLLHTSMQAGRCSHGRIGRMPFPLMYYPLLTGKDTDYFMKGKKSGAGNRYAVEAEALAAPIAEPLGIYIYDVEYVRDGQEYFLNVYIDKEGGVTIGDCETVSRALSDALDSADLISDPYTLIVSSPGLGRALTKDRHLQHGRAACSSQRKNGRKEKGKKEEGGRRKF